MKKKRSFWIRIQNTWQKWRKWIIPIGLLSFLLGAIRFIVEAIGGDIIVRAWDSLMAAIIPSLIGTFQTHPYLFELTVFLALNSILIIYAYVTSGPPRGLIIYDKKIGMYTRIVVENNTGDDLYDCELEVLNIVALDSRLPYKLQGLHNKLQWHTEGNIGIGITTTIKDKTHGEAGTVVSWADGVIGLEFPYQYVIRDGKCRAEVLFTGHTKQGDTKSSKSWLEIERDGENFHVEVEI